MTGITCAERLTMSAGPQDLFDALPGRHRFLLESGRLSDDSGVPEDERRWSFLGADPFLVLSADASGVRVEPEGGVTPLGRDPFAALEELLLRYAQPLRPDLPPFAGGAVGFLGYDVARRPEPGPGRARADLPHVPDLLIGFYDLTLAYDHGTGDAFLVEAPVPGRDAERERLKAVWRRAFQGVRGGVRPSACPRALGPARASLGREAYVGAVATVLDHIRAGDVYQVNLSQRLSVPYRLSDAWPLYRTLAAGSPAPFGAYLEAGRAAIASISPERFLRLSGDGVAETRPIKGTRRRGRDATEDDRLAAELWGSEKDLAELLMVVDMERNDLGRLAVPGTVRVADLRRLERHPSVMHTVATVRAMLAPGTSLASILAAMFPSGSVTGAPKLRAMEIIDVLEPVRRGPYTGAIGYLGFDGRADLAVSIRTAVLSDGWCHYHAGGGIVWDSDPEAEYEESVAKARAWLDAVTARPPVERT